MRKVFIIAGAMIISSGALAADYRSQYYEPHGSPAVVSAAPAYVPYVPPVYYLPSPPQYVQDLRAGAPGRWVQLQPSLLDRLFGTGDGYWRAAHLDTTLGSCDRCHPDRRDSHDLVLQLPQQVSWHR